MVRPIPEGFRTVTPFIMVKDAAALLDFMKEGLDAEEVFVLHHGAQKVGHAQMKIGDSMVMVGDAENMPELKGAIYLYVPDADAAYDRAVKAGASSVIEPEDQFYGDRMGGVKDPFGNTWWFATHIEDVAEDKLEKRAMAAMKDKLN